MIERLTASHLIQMGRDKNKTKLIFDSKKENKFCSCYKIGYNTVVPVGRDTKTRMKKDVICKPRRNRITKRCEGASKRRNEVKS